MIEPMMLATRCPTCQTVFRVERARLTATEGWVRCGHCQGAFNANASAVADPPVSAPAPFSATATVIVRSPHSARNGPGNGVPERAPTTPQRPATVAQHVLAARARTDNPRQVALPEGAARAAKSAPRKRWQALDDFRSTVQVLPDFLRRADVAARWRSPWLRAVMLLCALFLVTLAALQAALLSRDTLVSRWPDLREPLTALCEPLRCRVGFVRNIDALVLDSSGLTRIADSERFRLTLVLRNRDPRALLLPAVDLALTDEQGAVISRRVLLAADLGAGRPDIEATAEVTLQAVLDVRALTVAGYTVGIFYP